jgi:hypothetical protein
MFWMMPQRGLMNDAWLGQTVKPPERDKPAMMFQALE